MQALINPLAYSCSQGTLQSLKPMAPMFTEQSLPQQVQQEDTERRGSMLIRSQLEHHNLSSPGKEMWSGANLGCNQRQHLWYADE